MCPLCSQGPIFAKDRVFMRTHFGAGSTLTGNQGVILRLCNLIPRRTTFSWDSRKVHYQRFNLGAKFNENSLTTECCFAEIRGWVCNQGRRREVIALLRCPCFAMDHQVCVCLHALMSSHIRTESEAFCVSNPAPCSKQQNGLQRATRPPLVCFFCFSALFLFSI